MMKVILDTNVLISAIFFSGPPSRILAAWIEDEFELVVSTDILEEYREVASRIGEKFPGIELGPVLDRIVANALLIVPRESPRRCLHGSGRHQIPRVRRWKPSRLRHQR